MESALSRRLMVRAQVYEGFHYLVLNVDLSDGAGVIIYTEPPRAEEIGRALLSELARAESGEVARELVLGNWYLVRSARGERPRESAVVSQVTAGGLRLRVGQGERALLGTCPLAEARALAEKLVELASALAAAASG